MLVKNKILEKFTKEELWLQFSAVQDEEKMDDCIEKILKMFPISGKKIAVETGTFHGVSACVLAKHFDEIHTFDIIEEHGGYYKDSDLKFKIWDYFGVSDKIHFHLINSDSEKKEILKDINYDFAWIDGMHKGGVDVDYELLKKCGRILFHDYEPKKCKDGNMYDYVVNFIDSIEPDYINEPFAVKILKGQK